MFGGGNQISLSSWVKAGWVAGLQTFVTWQSALYAIHPPHAWAWYRYPGGQIELSLYSQSTGSLEYVVSSGAISAGTWTHVYATYDGTTMRMYINGTADPNTQATSLTVGTSSIDVSIGQNQISGHNNFYDGNLDEVRISSTARSAGWIATEYANQSNPTAFYGIGGATSGGVSTPGINSPLSDVWAYWDTGDDKRNGIRYDTGKQYGDVQRDGGDDKWLEYDEHNGDGTVWCQQRECGGDGKRGGQQREQLHVSVGWIELQL